MTNAYDTMNKHYHDYLNQVAIMNNDRCARTARMAMYAYSKYLNEFEKLTDAGMVPITY